VGRVAEEFRTAGVIVKGIRLDLLRLEGEGIREIRLGKIEAEPGKKA